jgi:WD40 repeat protein
VSYGNDLSGVAYSPDGRLIATSSLNGSVVVWDAQTAVPVSRPRVSDAEVDHITFAPDGSRLAAVQRDGTISLFDPKTGRTTVELTDPDHGPTYGLAFLDAHALLTANDRGAVRRWDIASRRSDDLASIGETVFDLAVSPSGAQVAIGTESRALLVDLATGRVLQTFVGHRGFVNGVAFGPGDLLYSAGADGTVRVWDTANGDQAVQFNVPGGDVSALAVDRSGLRAAAVTTGGHGFVFDCEVCGPPDELARKAQARKTRELTPEERAVFAVP